MSGDARGLDRLGDERAQFLDLHETHYQRVVTFLMLGGATLPEAQDAAQEAFAEGWRAVATGSWQTITYPAAWIRAVAIRRYRRPRDLRRCPPATPTPPELLPENPAPAPDPAELTAQTMDVLDALRSLDEKCRAVLAFHMDGFSSVEIGRELNMDDQHVRNLLKKARAHLARILSADRTEGGTAG